MKNLISILFLMFILSIIIVIGCVMISNPDYAVEVFNEILIDWRYYILILLTAGVTFFVVRYIKYEKEEDKNKLK